MDQMQLIGLLGLGISIAAQVTLLALQLDALRAYGHVSFLRLGIGTACLLISAIVWGLPMVVPMATERVVASNWAGLALSTLGIAVSIWGAATLFRQYGRLHRAASSVPDSGQREPA